MKSNKEQEYKVTFKATIPGFFTSKTFTEMKIYQATSAQEAMSKAKRHVESELTMNGLDPEEDGFYVTITNVELV